MLAFLDTAVGRNTLAPLTALNEQLYEASYGGEEALVKFLIYQGADVNWRNGASDGNAPLHAAANQGHAVCCELLVRAGADIRLRGEGGNTALHFCAGAGGSFCQEHVRIIQFLLRNGADGLCKNDSALSPKDMLVDNDSAAVAAAVGHI